MVPRGARRGGVLVTVAVAVIVVAGCIQADDGSRTGVEAGLVFDADWAELALQNGDDHDHYDRAHHQGLSTPNFRRLGFDPLVTDHHGRNAGGYFCGDVAPGAERTLAVVESFTSDVAFVLIDVTDPTMPTKIGELVMERTHVWDIALTPDQRYVVLATSPLGDLDEEEPPVKAALFPTVSYRDACTGTTRVLAGPEAMLPYHSGVVLVDVSEPSAPEVADFRPLPVLGGHSIIAQEVGGDTIILVTVTNAGRTNYYAFMGILETPASATLLTHSVYQTGDNTAAGVQREALFMNHDGAMLEHPVTGERLAFLADGDWGVTILDIDDLTMPRVVSNWNGAARIANPDDWHFAHSILPITGLWDDRHYTFVSEECTGRPEETPSCLMYVLDTTYPSTPKLVSAWTLPYDVGTWSYPEFSPHYMALIGRTLFMAHWHAGVVAFDVSTPEAIATLPLIGIYVPDETVDYEPGGSFFGDYNMNPIIADIEAFDDTLIVFDGTSGVYTLAFDATQPAPAPEPWPLTIR